MPADYQNSNPELTSREESTFRRVKNAIRQKSVLAHRRPMVVQENGASAIMLPEQSVLDVFATNITWRDEHLPMSSINPERQFGLHSEADGIAVLLARIAHKKDLLFQDIRVRIRIKNVR